MVINRRKCFASLLAPFLARFAQSPSSVDVIAQPIDWRLLVNDDLKLFTAVPLPAAVPPLAIKALQDALEEMQRRCERPLFMEPNVIVMPDSRHHV